MLTNDYNNYIKNVTTPKLNLGCGVYLMDGWLNTDISKLSRDRGASYLNVGKPFLLPDSSFNFIYSEHLLEHLDYHQAKNMLNECYRVLKPNGIIRITTPSLEFLLDLYFHPEKELNNEYLKYDSKRFNLPCNPVYSINQFHILWGHKIIYDEKTLKEFLHETGFINIKKCEVGKSEHIELNNIEQHYKSFLRNSANPQFNKLQTMVFEAQK